MSLADSGQSVYYEPSDWATAALLAESMRRDLHPRPAGKDADGDPVYEHVPIGG